MAFKTRMKFLKVLIERVFLCLDCRKLCVVDWRWLNGEWKFCGGGKWEVLWLLKKKIIYIKKNRNKFRRTYFSTRIRTRETWIQIVLSSMKADFPAETIFQNPHKSNKKRLIWVWNKNLKRVINKKNSSACFYLNNLK